MIDTQYKVKRHIAVFSEETEEWVKDYDLSRFNLTEFQKAYSIIDINNPMFDCYPITESNKGFIETYIDCKLKWNFKKYSYFFEATSL